jgi:hypothetical protein
MCDAQVISPIFSISITYIFRMGSASVMHQYGLGIN